MNMNELIRTMAGYSPTQQATEQDSEHQQDDHQDQDEWPTPPSPAARDLLRYPVTTPDRDQGMGRPTPMPPDMNDLIRAAFFGDPRGTRYQ